MMSLARYIESVAVEAAVEAANPIRSLAVDMVYELRNPARPVPSELAESLVVVPCVRGAAVVAEADYAPYVEFGTAYQAPRPFLGPAFEILKADAVVHVRDRVQAALRRELQP